MCHFLDFIMRRLICAGLPWSVKIFLKMKLFPGEVREKSWNFIFSQGYLEKINTRETSGNIKISLKIY